MPAIRGRVRPKQPTSIGAATVELINSTGDLVDQVQIGDDGRFVFHVSSGTWRLKAYDSQGQRGAATAAVGKEEAEIELDLG